MGALLKGSSRLRERTCLSYVSCFGSGILTTGATREAQATCLVASNQELAEGVPTRFFGHQSQRSGTAGLSSKCPEEAPPCIRFNRLTTTSCTFRLGEIASLRGGKHQAAIEIASSMGTNPRKRKSSGAGLCKIQKELAGGEAVRTQLKV